VQVLRSTERAQGRNLTLVETWEGLQARLFHLGYLGEELPQVSQPGVSAWVYRVIAAEAAEVARIAGEYLTECEHHHDAPTGGGAL
jgi:hypothetical protein